MRYRDFKIQETVLGLSPTPSSLPGYIQKINDILASPNPVLQMGANGAFQFTALPGQKVATTSDVVRGKGQDQKGNDVDSIVIKSMYKGQLTGAQAADKGKLDFNRGEVVEGWHALAAFVRLIARPTRDITLKDVMSFIPKVQNGKTLILKVKDAENKELADEFHVTISLKPKQWAAFTNPKEALKDTDLAAYVKDVIDDANEETGRRADVYATNGKYDLVRVVGDGVSGETETKTDINFENETEKKFRGYSIKAGSTKQIHQVGGGSVKDGKGKFKATPEERYRILNDELFGVHGKARLADLNHVRKEYMAAAQDESVKGRLLAQEIAYRGAVTSINTNLDSDTEEKDFVKTLAKALKYFMARDDDSILLKQFSGKGTYILDAKRLDQLHDKGLDLGARYIDGKANPEFVIEDIKTGAMLIKFRTYKSSSGYMRNYIEKGDLFKELTNIKNQ